MSDDDLWVIHRTVFSTVELLRNEYGIEGTETLGMSALEEIVERIHRQIQIQLQLEPRS